MGTFVQNLDYGLNPFSEAALFEKAYWQSGYKMPLKWVVDKFWATPDAVAYYHMTKGVTKDITILSKDEYESANKAVELIRCSPFAASYFTKSKTWEELLHQVPIYFTLEGEEFKALLDGIRVDHKEKTIEPFDLKTIGKSVYDFKNNYLNYGYYTQAALYDYAIRQEGSPVLELIREGYAVKDFTFVVVETKISSTNPAIIFTTDEKERHAGLYGGYCEGKKYKGILELLEDYRWHVAQDQWVYPREVFQNEGKIPINCFS